LDRWSDDCGTAADGGPNGEADDRPLRAEEV